MKDNHRPFTVLGWIFGVIFMPTGMFIGLAHARVISWGKAIAWFVFFFGLQICFARGMARLEQIKAAQEVIQMFLTTGMMTICAPLFLIHYYGARVGYWNDKDRKAWRIVSIFFLGLMLLSITSIMFRIVVLPLWIRPG